MGGGVGRVTCAWWGSEGWGVATCALQDAVHNHRKCTVRLCYSFDLANPMFVYVLHAEMRACTFEGVPIGYGVYT